MGCSTSKVKLLVTEPDHIKSQPSMVSRPTMLDQQSHRILENFVLVWLLHDSIVNIENEKIKLQKIISSIKTFTDVNECIIYIKNIGFEKIFLIVPVMESWLHLIQDLEQIEQIYILNPSSPDNDKQEDQSLSLNTFSDVDTLSKQLHIDTGLCELDLVHIAASVMPSQDDKNSVEIIKQKASFLCLQFLEEVLLRLKFDTHAKDEFVNFCRTHYSDNKEQLRIIDDFEANYRPQKALWWLTCECFIWRIMRRIQRTQEIDIHYKIAFLVKHMNVQLNILQDNRPRTSEDKWIVYCGKTMDKNQFERLLKNNCGSLICFANFFTANKDKKIAIDFIHHRRLDHPHVAGVLFEIHVDPTIRNTRSPYALFEEIYAAETDKKNGIFFSIYTVFRIESVNQSIEQSVVIWTVKLTFIADDDAQLLDIISPLRSNEILSDPLSYLGKLFLEKGNYKQNERFFLGMLQDTSILNQPLRLTRVYRGLGTTYMHMGIYDKALEHYQLALEASLSYLSSEHVDLIPLYNEIGITYFKRDDYHHAAEYYEKAVHLLSHDSAQLINEQFISDLNSRWNLVKQLLDKEQ